MDDTNQVPVINPVNYAGFWRRFTGWMIDLLILIIICHWVLALVSKVVKNPIPDTISFSAIFSSLLPIALTILAVNLIVIGLYYSFFESSSWQATIGKRIAGLKITSVEGVRISFGRALARRVYSILSTIPFLIGYIVAGFTPRKQTFHDMLGKTVVVIDRPRKWIVLVIIFVLTIAAGMLSDKFLGAGFQISIGTPDSHKTKDDLRSSTIMTADRVDPAVKEAVISSYKERSILFATKDLAKIREYFLTPYVDDAATTKQINNMSDADFEKMVELLNHIQAVATEEILRGPDAVWTFSKDMDQVEITAQVTPTDDNPYSEVTVDMLYKNGKWY